MRADQYLIAYQAYKELGETEKALEMKKLWLAERERLIRNFLILLKKLKLKLNNLKLNNYGSSC